MLLSKFQSTLLEAGCDEAGRGCLAGPVFAAAIVLPDGFQHDLLDDSKKLSEKLRYQLRAEIQKEALAYAVAWADQKEIDRMNILNASFLAMHRAISQLSREPELLLIDGNRFAPYKNVPHQCIVQGDGQYCSIAAASVLAKTYRDDYMKQISKGYPLYDWQNNKGYPSVKHRAMILKLGYTIHHRRSFKVNGLG